MGRFESQVVLRKRAHFVTVEIVDYRWRSGDAIDDVDREYVLRWRADPPFLDAPAHLSSVEADGYGQLMFVPPDVHVYSEMASAKENIRNVVCRFDPKWLHDMCELPAWSDDDLQRCFNIKDPHIGQSVQRLGGEIMSPGAETDTLIESLARTLAVDISRYFRSDLEKQRVRTKNGELSAAHLQGIVDYIERNIHSPINVSALSELSGISAAHLRRAFKKTTGETVHEFIERIRIERVKKLLLETDYPLKEISFRTGFVDSSTFSSTFRRVVGLAPSEYRRTGGPKLPPSDDEHWARKLSQAAPAFQGHGFDGW